MTDHVKRRRRYDATRRQAQAQENRRAVISAAHRLFLDGGFAATTMTAIAGAAGVSVQTVYKVFGTKAGVAKAVFDVAIAGDDEPLTMLERPSLAKVRDEPDPRQKFRLYGEFLAEVSPRHVPVQIVIRDAAASDPDALAVWADLQTERLTGNAMFAEHLQQLGALRRGISTSEARDVIWAYNSPEVFQLLVLDRGWPPERYGAWIADALTAALL
ncbi:MAG: TetR/AcrR family transcriptional regulator [Acidimicrobiales bacterium]